MKKLLMFCLIISFVACSGGGGGDEPDPAPEAKDPEAADLVFPQSNSECTEGTNLSQTESTIVFEWNTSNYTDRYSLELKDLSSGNTTTYNSNTDHVTARIKRGTPYAWYVVSRSNSTGNTAKSSTWKFYNAGPGIESYAPFPAECVSPEIGGSIDAGNTTLDWSGSDIDNDIESYDVYFGENNPPEVFETGVEESILNNVSVISGKTYYWKVDTKDASGNMSTSDVFSFKVN